MLHAHRYIYTISQVDSLVVDIIICRESRDASILKLRQFNTVRFNVFHVASFHGPSYHHESTFGEDSSQASISLCADSAHEMPGISEWGISIDASGWIVAFVQTTNSQQVTAEGGESSVTDRKIVCIFPDMYCFCAHGVMLM